MPKTPGRPPCWRPPRPHADVDDVCRCLVGIAEWEALRVTWHSLQWQRVHFQDTSEWTTSARAFQAEGGRWRPLLEVAAHCAFWSLPISTLKAVATHIGLHQASHVSLCQVLWQLILAILACDAEKAFAIIEQRMASLHHGAGD